MNNQANPNLNPRKIPSQQANYNPNQNNLKQEEQLNSFLQINLHQNFQNSSGINSFGSSGNKAHAEGDQGATQQKLGPMAF